MFCKRNSKRLNNSAIAYQYNLRLWLSIDFNLGQVLHSGETEE